MAMTQPKLWFILLAWLLPLTLAQPQRECRSLADICFILDSSGSIREQNIPGGPDNWATMLSFVSNIVANLAIAPDEIRVGMVSFSDLAELEVGLGEISDKRALRRRIEASNYRGMFTNTADALSVARRECFGGDQDRPQVRNIVIFISDGLPTRNQYRTDDEIQRLHNVVDRVISIGITNEINEELLEKVSKAYTGKALMDRDYFLSLNFNDLDVLVPNISQQACTECTVSADLCFVLDSSGSIRDQNIPGGPDNWNTMLSFINSIVRDLAIAPNEIRVGLVVFSDTANLEIGLGTISNKQDLMRRIQTTRHRNSETNTAAALRVTRRECFGGAQDRPQVRNIVIFISDGLPNPPREEETTREIRRLHSTVHRVISIGITNRINEEMLRTVSKAYSGPTRMDVDYFLSLNFNDLASLIPSISQETCEEEEVCFGKLDICFIIDSSGSIRDQNPDDGSFDNWRAILTFINRVVDSLDIGRNRIHVGAVKFSESASVLFNLDDFTDKASLQRNILATSFVGGLTNTAAALRLTRTSCFDRQRGDRQNVPNMAIIITDGIPTVNEADTIAEAQRLKAFNQNGEMNVIAIGITNLIDKTTLRRISSPPQLENQNYYLSPDFLGITNIISNVVKEVCDKSVLIPACTLPRDVAFLLDASDHTSDDLSWQKLQEFMRLAAGGYRIDQGTGRAALVLMSNRAQTVFNLNSYSRYIDIERVINQTRNLGQGLNIAAGLRSLRNDIFTSSRGDRTDISNIAIVLVAGPTVSERQYIRNEAERLRQNGVEVFAVGLTPNVPRLELEDIASQPFDNHIFTARGVTTAASTLPALVPETCRGQSPDCPGSEADIVFIVDASGSIHEENFKSVLQFISSLIGGLDINSGRFRVGALTFSDQPREIFKLNQYSRVGDIQIAVMNIPFTRGTTDTASALRYTRETLFSRSNGNRVSARDVAIIITDGASNNAQQTLEQARLTRLSGVHVITIGVGNWLDQYELEAMASYPTEENRYHVRDFGSLSSIRTKMRDVFCDSTNACVSNPCRNGGTCVNELGYYSCNCRLGYAGINCERRCRSAADIAFVLDASGSIGKQNFDRMLDFLTTLVMNLDVDNGKSPSDGVRVAMVTYSDNPQTLLLLGDNMTKKSLLNALRTHYIGGATDTAEALRATRETVFGSGSWNRPGVQNLAFVITDGRSIDPDATWREAVALRNEGTHILVLGITDSVNPKELQSIASSPADKNIIYIDDFQQLPTTLDSISASLCNNENECEPNPCNGVACMDGLNGYTCAPCPPGRSGAHCERRTSGMIDLVFVLDASGSIRSDRFPRVLNFVASIISSLDVHPDRTRVGAIWFSDTAAVQFNLNDYTNRQDTIQAIRRIRFRAGRTHTSAALSLLPNMYTAQNGARDTAARITIVLSDGNSNINEENTVPSAIDVKVNTGVHMMVVSVGMLLNQLELEGIASRPTEKNLFAVESINDLNSLISILTDSVFDEEDECQSNPCQNGGECINSLRRFVCNCRPGFTGISCNRRCSRQLDVAFLLDLSGSVEAVHRLIMEFARRTVYGFDMSFGRVRVATIAFADQTVGQFYLNTYQDKESVLTALSFSNRGGLTNIAEAIQRVRYDIFSGARGDRAGIRNVAILVSDGHSTLNEAAVLNEAEVTRRAGIEIFAIAIGDDVNRGDLTAIASDPDSSYVINLRNSNEIDSASDQLLDQLCA